MNQESWDVIVIGGGAAGLNAALVLARARRRVVVVDAGEPRNRFAPHMHGFLSRDGMSPLELLEIGRAEVRGYGGEVVSGRAVRAGGEAGAFTIELDDGRMLTGRRLVIATGLRDELPDIPGLARQWGRGAVACPYCDGWESRDQRIGVLATSAMSVHQAGLLRQWSADVTFVGPLTADLDPETRAGLEARGVRIDARAVSAVVEDADGTLTGLTLEDDSVLPLDRVFVGPRLEANDELLRQLGAARAETMQGEWVASDAFGATSVPGVWVAGNSAVSHALVVMAAASGASVATQINADLVGDDTRRALATQSSR
ncbi:NAD(P)/FAD-dependent oxidoreductase [Herbiconiux sp. CPCC 205763]|uniref:NAD(P)/FAD-dependent oxidoreductase n=1 Tax=Herbiconiux aconitum TaxID=2970913 RepID=A0ABT2GSP2_9MICO|nr:NAD(P)/FAD-dependent oxidoreductase [Herbiconiux aconitum]MCS5717949.1 NAD(P)/FAD-dependent oxidoreductase [Herbiconiux aconitum]